MESTVHGDFLKKGTFSRMPFHPAIAKVTVSSRPIRPWKKGLRF